jgi:hypothetical protein
LDHWDAERLIFFPWVAVNNCSGCVVEFVVVGFVEILDAVRNGESFARERDSMSFTCSVTKTMRIVTSLWLIAATI